MPERIGSGSDYRLLPDFNPVVPVFPANLRKRSLVLATAAKRRKMLKYPRLLVLFGGHLDAPVNRFVVGSSPTRGVSTRSILNSNRKLLVASLFSSNAFVSLNCLRRGTSSREDKLQHWPRTRRNRFKLDQLNGLPHRIWFESKISLVSTRTIFTTLVDVANVPRSNGGASWRSVRPSASATRRCTLRR